MKPFEVAGQQYNKETLSELRERIIELRDKALEQCDFELSVLLSHNIGILYQVVKELES